MTQIFQEDTQDWNFKCLIISHNYKSESLNLANKQFHNRLYAKLAYPENQHDVYIANIYVAALVLYVMGPGYYPAESSSKFEEPGGAG